MLFGTHSAQKRGKKRAATPLRYKTAQTNDLKNTATLPAVLPYGAPLKFVSCVRLFSCTESLFAKAAQTFLLQPLVYQPQKDKSRVFPYFVL